MRKLQRTARDVADQLETSPAQLYRLLDPANCDKSFRQLVTLLSILGGTVEMRVTVQLCVADREKARKKRGRLSV